MVLLGGLMLGKLSGFVASLTKKQTQPVTLQLNTVYTSGKEMTKDHPVIEVAKHQAEDAKKGTADLATKIVNAIVASPDKAEEYIVNLRETLIEIYQKGRWDGMRDATNVLMTGTPAEKIEAKQVEKITEEAKRDTTRVPQEILPKLGLPCTMCGTYSESGKPCAVCETRKKRGMIPS
jgi:rubrerythrin